MKLIQHIEQALPSLQELSLPKKVANSKDAKAKVKKAKAQYPAKTLLAYPCEEVYALGCSPFAEENIDFLIQLKGRKPEQGFVIVAPSQYSVIKLTDLSNYNFTKLEYKNLPKILKAYLSPESLETFLTKHLERHIEYNFTSSCMMSFCGNLIDYIFEGLDYQALEFFDKEDLLQHIRTNSRDLLDTISTFLELLLTKEDFANCSLGARDFFPYLLDPAVKAKLDHSITKDDLKVFQLIKSIFSLPLIRQVLTTALLKLSITKVPVTFVLPKKSSVTNKHLFGKHGTLAIRFPVQAALRELLNRTGPLISTSANLHGSEPLTSSEQIIEVFASLPDTENILVLEGSIVSDKIPSVIVDLQQGIFYRSSEALLEHSADPETSKLLFTLLNL